VSPLNVAAPPATVLAVALLAVAPACTTVAVTSTPAWLTTLPFASCSWTTGCWASATLLCALLEGGVVSASLDAGPALTTTVAVCVTGTPLTVADTVFDSATVELRVPVATPLAFVVAAGCVTVLPRPVALRTTVAPATGLPNPSRAVTVMVDALVPLDAVIGDVAATLDCAPETVLAATTTVAVCVTPTVLMVADTVFDSATSELRVPVATPCASVGLAGCVTVFPVPVADNTTVPP
jgi:hypothetical protein